MINQFDGEYSFLSNFHQAPVIYEGLHYNSNEAAFQSAKVKDKNERIAFTCVNPSKAKRMGRKANLRPDWEDVKDTVMYDVCKAKFTQNKNLGKKLLETGNKYLEEGNTWGDTTWGTVDGVGQNRLGKILMRVREELVNYTFDAKDAKEKCVQWIREWFKQNGPDCNAIIGISGGKDSSIVAALCVEALGKDRVIGVIMPFGEQESTIDAVKIVQHLGIKAFIHDITSSVYGLKAYYNAAKCLNGAVQKSQTEQANINVLPRERMQTLYYYAQCHNGRVANTCNLSEDWVGYSTRYGDSAGDFSPISRFTVAELLEMGKYIESLPEWAITRTPADDLCGKSDEDNLGFKYSVLDRYIRTGYIEDKEVKYRIDSLHYRNQFKLKMMPSFEYGKTIVDILE